MAGAEDTARIIEWIKADSARWELLDHVRELALPDCWVAAGFVRNMVWSMFHGRRAGISGDVDVIWFDRSDATEARDRALEARLRRSAPGVDWSVKNQARMNRRNGDAPYASAEDAMRFWPETATAIGVRRTVDDECELIAPFGLEDLTALTLRPAGAFADRKRTIFDDRIREKRWLRNFPRLRVADQPFIQPPPRI
jgi:hypothetical protein